MISWFRYVLHRQVAEYEAKGWILADDLAGTSHGNWSVLMKWEGQDEPA